VPASAPTPSASGALPDALNRQAITLYNLLSETAQDALLYADWDPNEPSERLKERLDVLVRLTYAVRQVLQQFPDVAGNSPTMVWQHYAATTPSYEMPTL
jgi:hypothetical protein